MRKYGREIAAASLKLGSIQLRPMEPFTWASGFQMPIYNDNRDLLSSHENRELVTEALYDLVGKADMDITLIAGTMTAGIAPAVSLADHMSLSLSMQIGGDSYLFTPHRMEQFSDAKPSEETDIVVSTCPQSLVGAVILANRLEVPFAYVRQKEKEHGLKRQIEGIIEQGQKAYLVDHHMGESYLDKAVEAINEKGAQVIGTDQRDISDMLSVNAIEGERMLRVEDLVSMGGSCGAEIERDRELGAVVEHAVAIFNYELETSRKNFEKLGVTLSAALTYTTLMEEVKAQRLFSDSELAMLKEWREDPLGWGAKHGFERVVK